MIMRRLLSLTITLAISTFFAVAQTPDDEDYWPVAGQDYAGDQTTISDSEDFRKLFNCDFIADGLAFNILSKEEKTVEVTSL